MHEIFSFTKSFNILATLNTDLFYVMHFFTELLYVTKNRENFNSNFFSISRLRNLIRI